MSITDDLRTDLTNARTRHRSDAKRIEFLEAENERRVEERNREAVYAANQVERAKRAEAEVERLREALTKASGELDAAGFFMAAREAEGAARVDDNCAR